ncbi:MAG: 3-phosphoshikimate 1-carboxyvinyltransferase [Candidatus Omnitrophica bacterium]|nr:3-phosphoshikimate 1-carboxyvinyltransferase [Candidatus Omnitrophota bacterium]
MLKYLVMYTIRPINSIKAEVAIPADKSISHRAVFFSAIGGKEVKIYPFLSSNDTQVTLDCIKKLGIEYYRDNFSQEAIYLQGKGLNFPKDEKVELFAGESGTTIRILSGLLVGQKFNSVFRAGDYLNERPMGRIVYPLRDMGANIDGNKMAKQEKEDIYPPLKIEPVSELTGKCHKLNIASAQVKSALLLAGLYAKGETIVEEPYKSRDHTERMLQSFGADIKIDKNRVSLKPGAQLNLPKEIFIPSDFSAAAFFIVLALILEKSQITIKNVNLNPSRCGLLAVLKRMNADIVIKNKKERTEPYGDIVVKNSRLSSTVVEPDEIAAMIDEVPIFCVAAAYAKGQTQIKGLGELKVKETDRVFSMVSNLSQSGVDILDRNNRQDGCQITINGGCNYSGGDFKSFGDHRTAMSLIIFALAAKSKSKIDDIRCIDKSFPGFIKIIEEFKAR